jgi:CRISPR-associated protein Csb2
MRLFQALVAGNGPSLGNGSDIETALCWLESQPPPTVLAPPSKTGVPCPLYVPNNAMDLVAKGWVRGNTEASIAEHRTLKTARPTHLRGGDTVHYLWPIASNDAVSPPVGTLTQAVERMVALGWGMDLVVAQCRVLSSGDATGNGLERWDVAQDHATSTLRCPVVGSLDALVERHAAFLNRLADDTFHPVPPLTAYRAVGYRRPADPISLPTAVFELRHDDGSFCRYSQRKLIHIAGMVRHLAIEAMQRSPPSGVADDWVERYVAGHRDEDAAEHRQFSYLPLPSIGHDYSDQAVRRVMVAAPVGDDAWLKHLAVRLAGKQLKPEPTRNDPFGEQGPPTLMSVYSDKVARRYTAAAKRWASVTPVILPGHNDRKTAKTRKLIEAALTQSGIEQPCTYEWSAHARFRNSLSAHKYHKDRDTKAKRWQFQDVKEYLQGKTWVHLTLTFDDELMVGGPLAIGAGRHCGFGLMAALQ